MLSAFLSVLIRDTSSEFLHCPSLVADEFIAVKSFKAKGKRVTNYVIDAVTELEPREVPEEEPQEPEVAPADDVETPESAPEETSVESSDNQNVDDISQEEVRDRLTGQIRLFDDNELTDA